MNIIKEKKIQEFLKSRVKIYGLNQRGEGLFYGENSDSFGKSSEKLSALFTLPGEDVVVNFPKTKKSKYHFFLEEILKASEERIDPICQHFTHCGGCTLQHMNLRLYREFKESLLLQALEHYNLRFETCDKMMIVDSTKNTGKRRRANMEAIKKEETLFLGFHRFKSHQIINITECPVLTKNLETLISPLKEVLNKILNIREKANIFLLQSDTGVDIALEIVGRQELSENERDALKKFCLAFENKANLSRLFFRYRKAIDVLFQKNEILVEFDRVPVEVDAYSFLQSSKESDTLLSNLVLDGVMQFFDPLKKKIAVADLFSGRGTFSLPLSRFFNVCAFESDKKACEALKKASIKSDRPINVVVRDLFQNPLKEEELDKFDAIILDPPRAGSHLQIQYLKNSNVPLIIYVSCNIESFAKDASSLNEHYRLLKITPIDQFLFTPHCEVCAVFIKK
jgi:23S rRNA (uracil1939-C5)-methyltransferase